MTPRGRGPFAAAMAARVAAGTVGWLAGRTTVRPTSEELLAEAVAAADAARRLRDAVVVVLPARNEAASLPAVLAALPVTLAGRPCRAVVVDDGSTDATAEVAAAAGALVVRLGAGRGQGLALRAGYRIALDAGAAVVVAMDADGQHRAQDLPLLVGPVAAGEADIVTGSRVLGAADPNHRVRELGVPVLAALMSLPARRRVTDPACGYRAMTAAALARLPLRQDQFHNAELLVAAGRLGLRVAEVPVTLLARQMGVSRKPPTASYAAGFVATLLRTWARTPRAPRPTAAGSAQPADLGTSVQ